MQTLSSSGEILSQGSGVVVGKSEIATNCHVVENAQEITVHQTAGAGGQVHRINARLLVRDNERDLCLLLAEELSESSAEPVEEVGKAGDLSVGEAVLAVGAPEGLELSLSRGLVSQLRNFGQEQDAPLVQTDAAISPGSSGGGLFNQDGELVGITTFKWKGENLNFAIPAEWIGDLRKAEEKRRECVEDPDYECVIAYAQFSARNIPYIVDRPYPLSKIALAQKERGDEQAMRDTFDAAFSDAQGVIDAGDRAYALSEIAMSQGQAGNEQAMRIVLADALSAVSEVGNKSHRIVALRSIAENQVKAGDISSMRNIFESALSLAREIAALPLAREIGEGKYTETLRHFALMQAKAGDMPSARRTFAVALSVAKSDHLSLSFTRRLSVLRALASSQAEVGDIDGAFTTLQNIVPASADVFTSAEYHRARALCDIASAQEKAGDKQSAQNTIADALQTAHDIRPNHLLAVALRHIASTRANMGDEKLALDAFADALSAAQNINRANDRNRTLRDISAAQADSGYIDDALATAQSIDSEEYRAWAFYDIAMAQMDAGDIDNSLNTVRRSVGFNVSLGNERENLGDKALRNIALARAKLGDVDGAFATVRSINDAYSRDWGLRDIAPAQAGAGDFQGAMKIAVEIEDEYRRAMALASIAKHLAAREKG